MLQMSKLIRLDFLAELLDHEVTKPHSGDIFSDHIAVWELWLGKSRGGSELLYG